jgi:hypothetical protein
MRPVSHQTARLSAGRHTGPEDGVCVLELASMLAGEPFTDRPRSVSPCVASLLRGLNDGLDDERRQALKRFAATSVGTVAPRGVERRRRRVVGRSIGTAAAHGGPLAWASRLVTGAYPYPVARETARRIAAGDDALYVRVLGLLDELILMRSPPDDRPFNLKALLGVRARRVRTDRDRFTAPGRR